MGLWNFFRKTINLNSTFHLISWKHPNCRTQSEIPHNSHRIQRTEYKSHEKKTHQGSFYASAGLNSAHRRRKMAGNRPPRWLAELTPKPFTAVRRRFPPENQTKTKPRVVETCRSAEHHQELNNPLGFET